MHRKIFFSFFSITICFLLAECQTHNVDKVQIVFFDLSDFDKTDTLLIDNIDTVKSIRALFANMSETDAKFPRKLEITLLGNGISDVYYSNGKYVRSDGKMYLLPEGKEFTLFESILNSKFKMEVMPGR